MPHRYCWHFKNSLKQFNKTVRWQATETSSDSNNGKRYFRQLVACRPSLGHLKSSQQHLLTVPLVLESDHQRTFASVRGAVHCPFCHHVHLHASLRSFTPTIMTVYCTEFTPPFIRSSAFQEPRKHHGVETATLKKSYLAWEFVSTSSSKLVWPNYISEYESTSTLCKTNVDRLSNTWPRCT